MDNNLFQEAKDKIANLMSMNGTGSDQKEIQNVIESIYEDADSEQKQQLEELKQHLHDTDLLS